VGAIWHDAGTPSWLAAGPQFSFLDVAAIVQPAPESYEQARAELQRWERKFGAPWYRDNARRARELWLMKRPWWLV
jgi:hypothetical protein